MIRKLHLQEGRSAHRAKIVGDLLRDN